MIIGSCGYGATGSSVLTDLLHEYDGVQVYDNFEFVLAYRVDGLQSLEFNTVIQPARQASGDYAIKRFLEASKCYKTPFINKPCNGKTFYKLSKEYVSNIEQLSFKGIETADMYTGNTIRNMFSFFSKKVWMKFWGKILKKRLYWWPARKIHFCINPDNFYEETIKYTNNILKAMGADLSKPICLDQPFEGNHPENSMKFFEDSYAIVIDRDPRDLYLEYKYSKNVDMKFVPNTSVDDFIIYYRLLRTQKKDNDRIISIRFEEFIYEYRQQKREFNRRKEANFRNNKKLKTNKIASKYPNYEDTIVSYDDLAIIIPQEDGSTLIVQEPVKKYIRK